MDTAPDDHPPAAPPDGGGLPVQADPLRAVIFDVDGTLIDTERDGHRVAFNEAFAAAGLNYRWDIEEYGALLATAGGRQRLERYLQFRGHSSTEAAMLAARLHRDKTRRFMTLIGTGVMTARPGAAELISALREENVATAVATTGTRDWVSPLLDSVFGLDVFDVVVTGSDVTDLKPDPAAYREALARLNVTPAHAVAVEDSAIGVRAARAAGLQCVAVVNDYTRDQDMRGAAVVLDNVACPEGVCVVQGDPQLRAGLTVTALRRLVRRAA